MRKILIERTGLYVPNPFGQPEYKPAPPIEFEADVEGDTIEEVLENYIQNYGIGELGEHIGNIRVQKQTQEFDVSFEVKMTLHVDANDMEMYSLSDEEDVRAHIEDGNWSSYSYDEDYTTVNEVTPTGGADWQDLDV